MGRSFIFLLRTVTAAALAACAPSIASPSLERLPLAHSEPRTDDATPVAGSRRATIKYEVHGRPFPLPLVAGTIAGHPVLMLVDTGANSHVIAGWLARKVGLKMNALGDVGTDHVGKSIATSRVDDPAIVIDGWGPLVPSPVLATDVPEIIEKLGIGAFVSPQSLVEEGGAVVLDLARGELRPAPSWGDALRELTATGVSVIGADTRACQDNEGPIKGLAFVAPATVSSQRVDLLVDTGAEHSDIFRGSRAGKHLASQSAVDKKTMYTASGKITSRKLEGARVTAGSLSIVTDVDVIAGAGDPSCPRDGVLAMDVLRTCTLLFGRSQMVGRCLPPTPAR